MITRRKREFSMKSFYKKNVIITGAASGIGRLMAVEFAREKANIAMIDINRKALEKTVSEMAGLRTKVYAYTCDMGNRREVAVTAKLIKRDFEKIDILINNAGIVTGKKVLDLTIDEIQKTMDVNFMGPVMMIKHFLPDMVSRNNGHIVNIASSAGLLGMPGMSDYCASKFADVGFSDSLRMEMKKYGYTGITITCVCPYVIDTGMFSGFKPFLFHKPLQPGHVVKKVIDAIRKEKPYVCMPFSVKMIRYLKLFPAAFQDSLLFAFGADRAMDAFKGSRSEK